MIKKFNEWCKKPVTWGGYLKLSAWSCIIGWAVMAVCIGYDYIVRRYNDQMCEQINAWREWVNTTLGKDKKED